MAASGWVGTTWRRSTGPVRWARPSTSSEARRRGAGRHGLGVLVAVLGLLTALAGAASAGAPQPDDAETRQLRAALALAKTDSFYLELDLRAAELRLMLGGVPLRAYAYEQATLGRPRIAFLAGPTVADWAVRVWREGVLAPARPDDRAVITPPGADAPAAPDPALPPLPTDGPPPPDRYRVRFAGGFELEIAPAGHGDGLGERLRLLGSPRRPRLRVRLVLAGEDAASLYRCLPPTVALVVRGAPA